MGDGLELQIHSFFQCEKVSFTTRIEQKSIIFTTAICCGIRNLRILDWNLFLSVDVICFCILPVSLTHLNQSEFKNRIINLDWQGFRKCDVEGLKSLLKMMCICRLPEIDLLLCEGVEHNMLWSAKYLLRARYIAGIQNRKRRRKTGLNEPA